MATYKFIEIGTADFDTEVESCAYFDYGISIEPVKELLDRLPRKPNVTYLNAAISNYDGVGLMYHTTPEIALRFKLPRWARGCNSLGSSHRGLNRALVAANQLPSDGVIQSTVEVMTPITLIKRLEVERFEFLKIDTEGHDAIILTEFIKLWKTNVIHLPERILFEKNELSDRTLLSRCEIDLAALGYQIKPALSKNWSEIGYSLVRPR